MSHLRALALASTSGLALLLAAGPAEAACEVVSGTGTPQSPSPGAFIVCEGATTLPLSGIAGTQVRIEVRPGATVVTTGAGLHTSGGTILNDGFLNTSGTNAMSGSGDGTQLTNNGRIVASGGTGAAMVIDSAGRGAVLANHGLIELNEAFGLQATSVLGVTFLNTGTIRRTAANANNAAVLGYQDTVFTNSGTIEGLGSDSAGVRGVAQLANSGHIATTGTAVETGPIGTNTIQNSGTIESSGTHAVVGRGLLRLTNTGTIRSIGGDAIRSTVADSGTYIVNGAGGLIESTGGAAIFDHSHRTKIIENDGTIRSTVPGGYAIDTSRGQTYGRLILGTSSVIEGRVRVNGGDFFLELAGTGQATFDTSVLGTTWDVINFVGEKTGTSTWTLTGATAQPWLARSGTLLVNGSIGYLGVETGAVVGGIGRAKTIETSGTIDPGIGVGTLTTTGNARFLTGSTFRVDVNGTSADRLVVGGGATLSGGTVEVVQGAELPPVGTTRYTVLTAAGGLGNTRFSSLRGGLAFLRPELSYTSTEVYLDLTRIALTDSNVVQTGNQSGTAGAIDTLPGSNPILAGVLRLGVEEARIAFDQLSGAPLASAMGVAAGQATRSADAALSRLRATPLLTRLDGVTTAYAADRAAPVPAQGRRGDVTLWGEAVGAWARRGEGSASLRQGTGGIVAGAEWGTGGAYRVGLAGSYTRTSFEVPALLASGSVDNATATLYGAGRWGGFGLRGGASIGHHDIEMARAVSVGALSGAARDDRSTTSMLAFAEAGYRFDAGAVSLEPFAGLRHLHVGNGRIAEEGNAIALAGTAHGLDVTTGSLGLHAAVAIPVGTGALTARATLAWHHSFGDITPAATFAFVGGSQSFRVTGVPLARDALRIEAGLDYAVTPDISLTVAYEGELARNAQEHALRGGVSIRF